MIRVHESNPKNDKNGIEPQLFLKKFKKIKSGR